MAGFKSDFISTITKKRKKREKANLFLTFKSSYILYSYVTVTSPLYTTVCIIATVIE